MAESYFFGNSVLRRTKRTENVANGDDASDWSMQPEDIFDGITTSGPMAYNTSDAYNVSEVVKDSYKPPYHFYKTEQLSFLCILFSLIVIGNVSVLVAIFLSKNRKSRMNFFIMQLAIADLTSGLVTVLTEIIWKTTVEWHAGTAGCKIVKYLQSVATYASTYVLVALSIDRLDAIARPMNFSGSGIRAKILIALAWGLSVVFSLPMLILCKELYRGGIMQCQIVMPVKWGWKFYMTMLGMILFIIPAVIICACYSIIVSVIWRKGSIGNTPRPVKARRFHTGNKGNGSTVEEKPRCQESHTSSRGLIPKARIKTIKMTLVIVIAFILCWSPFFIFDLLDVYELIPTSQRKIAVAIFIQSLSSLNSAANPVIYCLFSTRICNNWRRFPVCEWFAQKLCCICFKRPQATRFNTNSTDYTTVATDVKGRSRACQNVRRHSGTPYVKVTLSERDNEILLKHIRTPTNKGYSGTDSGAESIDESSAAV